MVKPRAANAAEAEHQEAERLLARADDLIASLEDSDFFKEHSVVRDYPLFDQSEIATGPLLGHGGFGVVYEIDEFILHPRSDHEKAARDTNLPESEQAAITATASSINTEERKLIQHEDTDTEHGHYDVDEARKIMVEMVRRKGVDARYAIKCLRDDRCEPDRVRGMIDAVIEVKLLSRLCHPNIVKMRGYSTGPLLSQNFFFIMDRLYDTLDKRIKLWRKELHPPGRPGLVRQMLKPNCPSVRRMRQVERDIMMERELVTYDLASAYAYMHENRLVYRDIKQQNIGFDVRGDVKVFDFGLCRGLSESMRAKDDSTGQPAYGYHLTPRTGSLPYLAPEVVECRPYDSKCDVFSFAILAWEIFTLKEAYQGITPPEFLRRVAACGERPCIPRKLKPLIKLMLAEAWDYDPRKRPNMRRVATMLRGDLNEMSDGDEAVIHRTQHMVNRSRHSMRVLQKQHADGKILPSSHGDWKL